MLHLAFTLATALMVAACVGAHRMAGTDQTADLAVGACTLALISTLTVIASRLTGVEFSRFPVFDLLALGLFWSGHRATPAQWKADLVFLLAGLLGVHAWFWALSDQGGRDEWTYVLLKNILFGSQLAVLTIAGSIALVRASLDRRALSRGRGRPDLGVLP